MSEQRPLQGRRALVTGAGIGIGFACAEALGDAGASVVIHHHRHAEGARALAAQLQTRGVKAEAIAADLSVADEVERLVDGALDVLGGLDVLVNNAGVTLTKRVEETEIEEFDWLIALNLRAIYAAIRRALPALSRSPAASVINMTSPHAALGFPGHSAYAASKGAIIALTRELAIELADRRIRVNAVGPGLIEVPRYAEIPGYTRELGASLVPLRRVGEPADVAAAVLWLSSDAASFVTGTTLWVDGGETARMGLPWRREELDEGKRPS